MSDLVRRLKYQATCTVGYIEDNFVALAQVTHLHELADEAAARIAALEAENKRLREAMEEIKELPGELNLSNYDQDDVAALNASHIQAFYIAQSALAQQEGVMDFTPRESQIIGQMLKAERTLPEDFWHVPAVQELACTLARYETIMSDDDCATLIACGALLARHSKAEIAAEVQMKMAIARARRL